MIHKVQFCFATAMFCASCPGRSGIDSGSVGDTGQSDSTVSDSSNSESGESDRGRNESGNRDSIISDSSYEDNGNCTCYTMTELRNQLLDYECTTGIIYYGCKENPLEFEKYETWGLCYQTQENGYGNCRGVYLDENCINCCLYPIVDAIDDNVTVCANHSVVVDVFANDIWSGYAVLQCGAPSHGIRVHLPRLAWRDD